MLVIGTSKIVGFFLMIVSETAFVGGNQKYSSLFIPFGRPPFLCGGLALVFQDQWNNSAVCEMLCTSKGKNLEEMFF